MQKYFWFSGFGVYAELNSGDGDHVKQMVAIFKAQGKDAEWIRTIDGLDALPDCHDGIFENKPAYGQFSDNQNRKSAVTKIIEYITQNSSEKQPVFHLTIRAPETGYIITPQDLLEFKKHQIRVVVICHEYNLNVNREKYRQSSLAYFHYADEVIFVNDKSKKGAIEDCAKWRDGKFFDIADLPYPSPDSLTQKSTFCPIPVTVRPRQEQSVAEILARPQNVLVFGNFRRLKGFEWIASFGHAIDAIKKGLWDDETLIDILTTAEISFATEQERAKIQSRFQDVKIIFAGSINPKFWDVYQKIARESFRCPDTIELHPNPQTIGLLGESQLTEDNIRNAANLSTISSDQLEELSKRCRYAFKGDRWGIRDNASGILSSMIQGCITFCQNNFDTDKVFISGEYKDSYIKVTERLNFKEFLQYLYNETDANREKAIIENQKKLMAQRFSDENIHAIYANIHAKLLSLNLAEKQQSDLADLNLLFDLVAGPSHHRIPSGQTLEGRKASVEKKEDILEFKNHYGRLIHQALVPFILGFDRIKDKKCFVEPHFYSYYGKTAFNGFVIDMTKQQMQLKGASAANVTDEQLSCISAIKSPRQATQLLLKRELEEVFLSHIADEYFSATQKMLAATEHYSDNALKATIDRVGFDFAVEIIGDGAEQKIEVQIKDINAAQCQELLQTDNLEAISAKCLGFLKTTLCAAISPELIQDNTIKSKAIEADKFEHKVEDNKIIINSTVKKITKKLWYERVPYGALLNIGPNGTILLLEHNSTSKPLELAGGRGGAPYRPKFNVMAEAEGEISVTMKKGSGDLVALSGFFKSLSSNQQIRMNGDCFYAPWQSWQAKAQKIQDPQDSNQEFTNDHNFTKCWSFADLRSAAIKGKKIRKAFDGIACYLSKKEQEIFSNIQEINANAIKDDNAAIIICGSKKTHKTELAESQKIGLIYVKKSLITQEKIAQICGDGITIESQVFNQKDYHVFTDIQPDQLVAALKYFNKFKKSLALSPARSYDAHDFSAIENETDIVLEVNTEIKKQSDDQSASAHGSAAPAERVPSNMISPKKEANILNFKITSYGILGTDYAYDTNQSGNSDGLNNKQNFVIVDPAGSGFCGVADELSGLGASGAIYKILGKDNKIVKNSRPTLTQEREGITRDTNNQVVKIEAGYALFNNVWQGDQISAPAGIIHAIGPNSGDNEERQHVLIRTLKNIFIEYHHCAAKDAFGSKVGLRIPAISSGIYAGQTTSTQYSKIFYQALTIGYDQACAELKVSNIDFGNHGLEICFYGKKPYEEMKKQIQETKYQISPKTVMCTQDNGVQLSVEGQLFHPHNLPITKLSATGQEYIEAVKFSDNYHDHDFLLGQNSEHTTSPSLDIAEILKKHLKAARCDLDLNDDQAAIIILIAIKNGGIYHHQQRFKEDLKTIMGKDFDQDGKFLEKAIKFSSSFQQNNNAKSILTGNPKPAKIVGMRLKRLTIDFAYEMISDKSKFEDWCNKLKINQNNPAFSAQALQHANEASRAIS